MASKGRKGRGKKDKVEEEPEQHDVVVEQEGEPAHEPKVVHYCPHCRYTIDYCEFSNCFEEKCLPYLKENFPDLAQKLEELRSSDKHKYKSVKSVKNKEQSVKTNVGGEVFLKIKQRTQRKYVTLITGLENYGVDLAATAQAFKKKFACGTSVSYDPVVELEVQGDIKREIHPIMVNEWKIPNDKIWTEVKIVHDDGSSEKKRILVSELLKRPDKRDRTKDKPAGR